jgi:hypothetical protein
MGNVLSDEEDDQQFLEDGFNLESPDADKVINYGTAAPVWQNKAPSDQSMLSSGDDPPPNAREDTAGAGEGSDGAAHPRRSNSVTSQEDRAPPKKLSYIQMAKLGYQELVNAIIRPPRADYKVRRFY